MPRSHPVCFVGLTQETHNLGSDDTEELSPHEHCDQGLNWMNFLSHAFTRMCVHVCACVCVCVRACLHSALQVILFFFLLTEVTLSVKHILVLSPIYIVKMELVQL